jgi:AcrR family transcriptional regulator
VRQADHNERREIFAAAALRVIMRAGVGGLTVREVAKEAGFTTGALTHYFESKDQVFIEASEYAAKLVRPRMERFEQGASATEALRKVVGEAMPTTKTNRSRWRIWVGFWERSSYNPDVAKVMRIRYEEWRGRLATIIRRAQAQGEMPASINADHAAQELVALIDGIGVQELIGGSRFPAARQREIINNWITRMAASDGEAVAAKPKRPTARGV